MPILSRLIDHDGDLSPGRPWLHKKSCRGGGWGRVSPRQRRTLLRAGTDLLAWKCDRPCPSGHRSGHTPRNRSALSTFPAYRSVPARP